MKFSPTSEDIDENGNALLFRSEWLSRRSLLLLQLIASRSDLTGILHLTGFTGGVSDTCEHDQWLECILETLLP